MTLGFRLQRWATAVNKDPDLVLAIGIGAAVFIAVLVRIAAL